MKTNWCVYFKGYRQLSDIFECSEGLHNISGGITVQQSEDKTVLEKTIKLFSGTKRLLTIDDVRLLKEHHANNDLLKIAEIVGKKTGETLCCKPAIEKFMETL